MRWGVALCTAAGAMESAFAHVRESVITPQNWLSSWSWDPGIVLSLVLLGGFYAFGQYRLASRRQRNTAVRSWQIGCFWLGYLSLILALDSPLHKLGEVLFSAHMTQHELLMVLAAPLLALGRPLIVFLFALPLSLRIRLGRLTQGSAIRKVWELLSSALVVWLLQAFTLWIWHLPSLYQATLENEAIHALQHTMFLGSALLFWWTLLHGRHGRLGYGAAFLYIFTTFLHTSLLGALITLAGTIWYPVYKGRTIPWHLTSLEDQQLGGLIMWVPSCLILIVVGLALFTAWMGEAERRQRLSSFSQSFLEEEKLVSSESSLEPGIEEAGESRQSA